MFILMPSAEFIKNHITDYYKGKVLLKPIKYGLKIYVSSKLLGLKYMKSVGVIIFANNQIHLFYSQEDFFKSELDKSDGVYTVILNLLSNIIIDTDYRLDNTWTSYDVWKKYNRPDNYTFKFVKRSVSDGKSLSSLLRHKTVSNTSYSGKTKRHGSDNPDSSDLVSLAVGSALLSGGNSSSRSRDYSCGGSSHRDSDSDSTPTCSGGHHGHSSSYGSDSGGSSDSGGGGSWD